MKEKNRRRKDLTWTNEEPVLVQRTRIFDILSQKTCPPGQTASHDFTILKAPDWVNVIPLTAEGKVVLIEQFRHGVSRVTLEIPGGVVDAGETPEDCALRELVEETGFRASGLAFLGRTLPNPAFLTNVCHTFLATGCVSDEAAREPDETESIRVLLENLERIPSLIADESIDHALVVVAFTHLSLSRPDLLRL
jgi:8-oxo-dGTP pyrophosphatase MutT (NUDIX family)